MAAFKALSEEGVFVIRYGGWHAYIIYTALIDAGFTIRMKQPKIHVQDDTLVNRKARHACGHAVNGHFQIIVAFKSSDHTKQHINNTSWMLSNNKFSCTASILSGIPAVPYNRKLTVDGRVVRQQQMSLVEARSSINFANPQACLWTYAVEPAEWRSPVSFSGDSA